MNATLTERYVAATVKNLPPAAQDDVQAELEASITDAVEGRTEQGEEHHDAERAVLTELGNPVVLAAGYADRPLHLIGPRYYLTWWRLLKLLLLIIPVTVTLLAAFGQAVAGRPIGALIGESIGTGISTAVHVAFWVTIVFAILERTGADALTDWDVDRLPDPQPATVPRSEPIATLLFLALIAGALVWDQQYGFVRDGGDGVAVLNPDLWPWAIGGLLALIGVEAILAVVVYARGYWTAAHAVANTALNVLFAIWGLTLLGRGELLSPEFLERVGPAVVGDDVLHILGILLGFGIAGVLAWSVIDGWLKQRRAVRRMNAGV